MMKKMVGDDGDDSTDDGDDGDVIANDDNTKMMAIFMMEDDEQHS